jgi:succinate-semialdehyde dehydrogenase / glutarate-semialdehyde dehydrogenase
MTVNIKQVPTKLFIGGEWCDASDGASFEIENPADKKTIASVSSATIADGQRAASIAQEAMKSWKAMVPRARAEILRKAFELMIRDLDAIADLIVLENGKPRVEAVAEVHYAAEFFRWFAEEAVRLPGHISTAPVSGRKIVEISEPIGVALLVAPWNLPAAMITRKVAPALAAGCAVVIKPAGNTAMTALYMGQLLAKAGVPAGVVNIIPTMNHDVVAELLKDSPVRTVSFTGSTRVGQLLMRQAVDRVLKCSMELGGNAPFIVFEDADIELAVESAMVAKMRHNAEACTAANRFLVHKNVKSEFTSKFAARMAALRVGDGMDPTTQVGPLASSSALGGMVSIVDDALSNGAKVVTGGSIGDEKGYYYLPTVLDNVAPDAALLNLEIFGPVAPVVEFSSDDEVVSMANSVDVGLGSYIHTRDLGRAMRIAEALEVGMVGVNTGIFSDPAAPFGGVKQSGLGREGGTHGILEFLETKYINVAWS